jgi:hypothetical protein
MGTDGMFQSREDPTETDEWEAEKSTDDQAVEEPEETEEWEEDK